MSVEATVVICTRDRPALLGDTVQSVLADTPPPAELLIVDQSASRDRRFTDGARVAPTDVRYLWSRGNGLSWARNVGAAEARHTTLAYVDDDILVQPGWLATLVAELESGGERTVVTGRVLAGEPELHDGFTPATVLDAEPAVHTGRLNRDVLAGGSMAIRRGALEAVGGWDVRLGPGTHYPAAEDNDLGFRLLEAGYRIAYVPSAVTRHRAWRRPASYPAVRWRYGLGKGGFYAKHASLRDRHILGRAARDVGRRFVRVPLTVVRTPRYALGELTYAAGVLIGFGRWQLTTGRHRP